jgi:catechol 2,3-dioxygenase-like lactoylglutathione lyase family enzyme
VQARIRLIRFKKQFPRSAISFREGILVRKENESMIRKMSHATIFVNNQDEALEFYRDKLGFKVHTDAMVGEDFRWLTMCTNDQPDFEVILFEPKPGMMMDEAIVTQLRAIMAKGVLGAGVFNTDDCHATYEELKAKGVEFLSAPAERPYGIEAVFKDNSGNWFSLTQPR